MLLDVLIIVFSLLFLGLLQTPFGFIIASLYDAAEKARDFPQVKVGVMGLLAVASSLFMWSRIMMFIVWTYDEFTSNLPDETLTLPGLSLVHDWVMKGHPLSYVWSAIGESELQWWWTQQRLLFACGFWPLYVYIESQRREIPYAWVYILHGQLVGISAALTSFYVALLLYPVVAPARLPSANLSNNNNSPGTPITRPSLFDSPYELWAPAVGSLLTVWVTPLVVSRDIALFNTFTMHVLSYHHFIPPFTISFSFGEPSSKTSAVSASPPASSPNSDDDESTIISKAMARRTYVMISLLTLQIRLVTILPPLLARASGHWHDLDELWAVLTEYGAELWATLYSNPAQSGFGVDLLLTSLAWLMWRFMNMASCDSSTTSSSMEGITSRGKETKSKSAAAKSRPSRSSRSRWWMRLNPLTDVYYPIQSIAYLSLGVVAPLYPAGDEL